MKNPDIEALNKRIRTDVLITQILSGVFAVMTVIRLVTHEPGHACKDAFIAVIALLTGLLFTDIRKSGKPFAKPVITKLRVLAIVVMCSGYVSQAVESIAAGMRSGGANFAFRLTDPSSLLIAFVGIMIGIFSEVFVYGHALQDDMDHIA